MEYPQAGMACSIPLGYSCSPGNAGFVLQSTPASAVICIIPGLQSLRAAVQHAAVQHLQLMSAQLPAHHHATSWFAATRCFTMMYQLCVLNANGRRTHQCGMLAQNAIPARYSAVTEPMPEVAPVTRATLPFRSVISVLNVKAHHKQAEKHKPTLALTETDIYAGPKVIDAGRWLVI